MGVIDEARQQRGVAQVDDARAGRHLHAPLAPRGQDAVVRDHTTPFCKTAAPVPSIRRAERADHAGVPGSGVDEVRGDGTAGDAAMLHRRIRRASRLEKIRLTRSQRSERSLLAADPKAQDEGADA
ncbi:MAG TPA: hypothetical protein VFY65_04245 [Longimicrobium sp.]|nr:hypothetical protein [Longimicrobium sp.]